MRAPVELVNELYKAAMKIDVVDAHTHIQDDILNFRAIEDVSVLSGTQASFNTIPDNVHQHAKKSGVLPRRLMMDATHGLSYSWFLQIAEGSGGVADAVICTIKKGRPDSRRQAGKMLIEALQPSRYSEYAEWLRTMFSFYVDDPEIDTLDPANYEMVCKAIDLQMHVLLKCWLLNISLSVGHFPWPWLSLYMIRVHHCTGKIQKLWGL